MSTSGPSGARFVVPGPFGHLRQVTEPSADVRCVTRNTAGPAGFTLIEVLVAMTVTLIGALGALSLIERANATTVTTRSREAAVNLAREVVESARGVPFASLTTGALDGLVQSGVPQLADDSPAPGWQIRRRGISYTVTTQLCTMDDARDGGGTQDAGSFCADSVGANTPAPVTGTVDRSPEDYKRARVQVAWTHQGVTRTVRQTTVVNNPGSAGGPAVRSMTLGGTSSPGWIYAPTTSLSFALTTSRPPATLRWLIDGSAQEPITSGSGLEWNFAWDLGNVDDPSGVPDGVYLVGTEAFDDYGIAGPSKSLTVTINRSLPDQVQGLVGGRVSSSINPEVEMVDLEWLAASERDVVGYEVIRIAPDGTRTVVCALQEATECRDASPPNADAVDYVVRAYDHASPGVQRPGPDSGLLTVTRANTPPNAPTGLTLTRAADGTTTLTWQAANPGDPDVGDSVRFYRVYRDGQGIADRYARWDDPSSTVSFVDSATNGEEHTYWVTSVDGHLGESEPNGPVR